MLRFFFQGIEFRTLIQQYSQLLYEFEKFYRKFTLQYVRTSGVGFRNLYTI